MPELPEVETVRKILKTQILNQKIISVFAPYEPILKNKEAIYKTLPNQSIKDILRFGKYLVFDLGKHVLIVHLRMEGKFYLKQHEETILKHEHVIIRFQSFDLRYHDTRKFGTFDLRDKANYLDVAPLNKLAKEPKDLDFDLFYNKIRKSARPIKSLLLDQTLISGLGNIYVDETLFKSHVHPLRKGSDIKKHEAKQLLKSADYVLDFACRLGGTTIRSYTASLGVTGRFQNELQVHMQQGKPCGICKRPIEKIKVGGRGTYVCTHCQK